MSAQIYSDSKLINKFTWYRMVPSLSLPDIILQNIHFVFGILTEFSDIVFSNFKFEQHSCLDQLMMLKLCYLISGLC
jgi:hypothetical protein